MAGFHIGNALQSLRSARQFSPDRQPCDSCAHAPVARGQTRPEQKASPCWGASAGKREFLFVDDLADACIFLLKSYSASEHINVGVGEDISINDLAETIKKVTGFEGALAWDCSKPDGTMLKRMDVSRIHDLGWRATTSFAGGLKATYSWFVEADRRGDFRGFSDRQMWNSKRPVSLPFGFRAFG